MPIRRFPHLESIWEFPKIRGTLLGVPITRTIVFWGLYWGPLILGNYHFKDPAKGVEYSGVYDGIPFFCRVPRLWY